jgi:DNA repair exonuclease SbcCD nuclease subunit
MKLLCFTDIHFGARLNSEQHLNDCHEFIDWFCDLAIREKATHIAFLGDWYENRNQISVRTLNSSHAAARKLDNLGLPVFFIVGNHDLFYRSNRNIFSTDPFSDFKNFRIISEPQEINKEMYAAPYLFHPEYPELAAKINSYKYVLGHFEFRNFVVTGQDKVLDHGPDAKQFTGPRYILSGHFHKRQFSGNVVYIGNAFPTNYGDAGDSERGAAMLDTESEDIIFYDYPKCPLFYKTRLSHVLAAENADFKPGSRVKCLLDIDIGYTDVQALKAEMIEAYQLREFVIEQDAVNQKQAISEGLEVEDDALDQLDNTVRQLIKDGVTPTATIDPNTLVTIFDELFDERK